MNDNASNLRLYILSSRACSLQEACKKRAGTKAAIDASIVRSELCARTNRAG
jgi:hypothetical protein